MTYLTLRYRPRVRTARPAYRKNVHAKDTLVWGKGESTCDDGRGRRRVASSLRCPILSTDGDHGRWHSDWIVRGSVPCVPTPPGKCVRRGTSADGSATSATGSSAPDRFGHDFGNRTHLTAASKKNL